MIVMKFGGTSVQDADAIKRLVAIVKSRSEKKLVVVSALSKITDQLLDTARLAVLGKRVEARKLVEDIIDRHLRVAADLELLPETSDEIRKSFGLLNNLVEALVILGEASPRSQDSVVALGELNSSRLVHAAFVQAGESCAWVDSREFIKTNSNFGAAAVDFEATDKFCRMGLAELFGTVDIAVAQGFIGSDRAGVTTTLGRGGSDYSGAIYGAAMNASAIEIWTDVDGILTTDPRIVPGARRIKRISFQEAAELASFGAKVLHPATIYPAVQKNISVLVLNSKNPTNRGTEITGEKKAYDGVVKAIATKKNITVLNLYSTLMLGTSGFLKKVFDIMARHQISIDLISTSEVNLSMTIESTPSAGALQLATKELSEFAQVSVLQDQAIVSVVGEGIKSTPGISAHIFGALKNINVVMISMGASELNLSFVVDGRQANLAIQSLHEELFSRELPLEVFE